jgi:hypothetical protein
VCRAHTRRELPQSEGAVEKVARQREKRPWLPMRVRPEPRAGHRKGKVVLILSMCYLCDELV